MSDYRLTHFLPDNLSDSDDQKPDRKPDNLSGDHRTRIEARCKGSYPDVENLLKNWTLENTKAANLVIAIRLFAALESGNLAAAEQIYEPLKRLFQERRTDRSARRSSSYKTPDSIEDSESEDPEKETRIQARMAKLADLTQMDLKLPSHKKKIRTSAEVLDRDGDMPYTNDELDRCVTDVIPKDYRYKPGEAPSLFLIEALISKVRALPVPTPVPAAQVPNMPEPADEYTPIPAYRGEHEGTWLAAQGELKIVMGPAYSKLIGPMKLVAVEDSRWVFVVPTPGMREAVRQQAVGELVARLESMSRARGKLLTGGIQVEVITEEDYRP